MLLTAHAFSHPSHPIVHAQFASATGALEQALHALAELSELNLAAATASVHDSGALIRQLTDARDLPQALQTLQAQAQPATEKFASYARHLSDIGLQAQAQAARAVHGCVAESFAQMNEFVAGADKLVPAGAEPFTEAFKLRAAQVRNSYEQLTRANLAMLESYQQQMSAMAASFTPANAPVTPSRQKKTAAATSD
jgi:phasin family protein